LNVDRFFRRLAIGFMAALAVLFVGCVVSCLHGCRDGPAVEICYDSPKYGKVCAVLVNGKWIVKAELGPAAKSEVESELNSPAPTQ